MTAEEPAGHAFATQAFSTGRAALASGATAEALRWLDRAHRLAPADPVVTLALAAACLGADPARAARLFGGIAAGMRPREGWFGLVAALHALGRTERARAALAATLGRFTVPPHYRALADAVAGEGGWCGLNEAGGILGPPGAVVTQDGRLTRVRRAGREVLGSPLNPRRVLRIEGHVASADGFLRGWVVQPGNPDAALTVRLEAPGCARSVTCVEAEAPIPGLPPLSRPRCFAVPRADLPPGPIGVLGPDGRDLTRAKFRPPRPPAAAPPRFLAARAADPRPAVLIVSHADGGGVERMVARSVAAHRRAGRLPILLRPGTGEARGKVSVLSAEDAPGPGFRLPAEAAKLRSLLARARVARIEIHHLLGHPPSLAGLIPSFGVPWEIAVHDAAWFCPRVQLVQPARRGHRYCNEPDLAGCRACIAAHGSLLDGDVGVVSLRARSAALFVGAARIHAPSADAARRLARHFPGLRVATIRPGNDAALPPPTPPPSGVARLRVAVAGALGPAKGVAVLLGCARDAARRDLPLEFVLVGSSTEDAALLETGRAFVTGPFAPSEAAALIRAQGAALGFIPSIWPEAWCFALTDLWRAGLAVAAFDLGAPAERIRATGRGFLIPPGISPARVNHLLLAAAARAVHEGAASPERA
ncbi:MAG: hypothetical protein KGI51_00980 [Rhodospirillales bacterium]|nr:hypothetical protein [Rhodospirillales bacterium]